MTGVQTCALPICFEVAYVEQLVSQPLPEHCPFCGEIIEDIQEEYIDDEDDLTDDDLKWE